MRMTERGIEVIEFQREGYRPLVDFAAWRVAVLKFCDDLKPENIRTMQRHLETDEVFVLLNGSCTLFTAGAADRPDKITATKMLPHKIYNVPKGVWHNHIMDEDGEALIVENSNTCDDNSPVMTLTQDQIGELAVCCPVTE